jgi:SSS family solute:Na+ symporter
MIAAAIYALFLGLVLWRFLKRGGKSETDYLLAGRSLTVPAFVATTVASWYGGILGVGEYSYRYGLSNWLVFGVPYYLYAMIFALFLAGRARRTPFLSLPDQLRARYGAPCALTGAAVLVVMTSPAAYVLSLGTLLAQLAGIDLVPGVILGTAMSIAYLYRGGLRSAVMADKVQFTMMFLGFAVLLPAAVARYGGLGWLKTQLPAGHLTWHGGQPVQAIAVWYFIAGSTLVDPLFYQSCMAARDEKTARRALLISVLFWILFDFMTTATGLYARAVLPNLDGGTGWGAQGSYWALAEQVLPPAARALFMVGLLATVISTIDSYSFLSAITFGRDIVWRLRGGRGDSNRYTRMGLLVTGVISVALALWRGSVIGLWHDLGSVGTPTLLFPVALGFTRRQLAPAWALAAMLAGGGLSLAWLIAGRLGEGYPLGLWPIYPGLIVSGILAGIGLRRHSARKD